MARMLFLTAVLLLLQPWGRSGLAAATGDLPVWLRLLELKPKLLAGLLPGSVHYNNIDRTWIPGDYAGWDDWCSRGWSYCSCTGPNKFQLLLTGAGLKADLVSLKLEALYELSHLFLGSNKLTGIIPDILGLKLKGLQVLSLRKNKLTGPLPYSFGDLSDLREFYVDDNKLSGPLPDSYGKLTRLVNFHGHQNQFTGFLPDSYGGLRSCKELSFHSNLLTGILPVVYWKLGKLKSLLLHNNKFTGGLPDDYSKLTRLTTCSLYNNPGLSGAIPLSWSTLPALKTISLQQTGCCLPGLLDSLLIAKLGQHGLSSCDAGFAPLSIVTRLLTIKARLLAGLVPGSTCYNNIDSTWLPGNYNSWDDWCSRGWKHIGSCSPNAENGFLPNTFKLDLSSCGLSADLGSLGLHELPELYHLNLGKNKLFGILPLAFSKLANLKYLYLHENLLTGGLPDAYGDCSKLEHLYLYKNKFTGILPLAWAKLSLLKHLFLHENELYGSLPDAYGDLSNLEDLYLYKNKFTGILPLAYGKLRFLKHFLCHDNLLVGSLPDSYGQLTNLEAFDCSRNRLTGTLPDSYGNLWKLKNLGLDDNTGLYGSVPTRWSGMKGLTTIGLKNTRCCVPISLFGIFGKLLGILSLVKCGLLG